MSPYRRAYAAPPDLLDVALASAQRPPRIVALRWVIVVGIVSAAAAVVVTSVALSPAPRLASHPHATPAGAASAGGAPLRQLTEAEEDELLREHGMYGLVAPYDRRPERWNFHVVDTSAD